MVCKCVVPMAYTIERSKWRRDMGSLMFGLAISTITKYDQQMANRGNLALRNYMHYI
jgi:hypothetical protein